MRNFLFSGITAILAFLVVGCGTDGDVIQKNIINGPPERPKTDLNILVLGESTAANFGLRMIYQAKNNVFEMNIDRKFQRAETPNSDYYVSLATGQDSSWLAYYGDLVFNRTADFDNVRFVNLSIFQYTAKMWTPSYTKPGCLLLEADSYKTSCFTSGPYGETVQNNKFNHIRDIKKSMDNLGYKFTHVIIQIGIGDAIAGTSKENYIANINELIQGLRDIGINAKIVVARSTYYQGTVSEEIRNAQTEVIDPDNDIVPGPDLDTLGEEYRYDGINWNEAGLKKVAELYNEYLR